MSMRDMILSRQNKPLQVLSQSVPNATNAEGMSDIGLPAGSRQIFGRLVPISARQALMYQSTFGVQADYELVSLDGSLQNGDRLQAANGWIFHVEGVDQMRIGMGTLQTYYKYPLSRIVYRGGGIAP